MRTIGLDVHKRFAQVAVLTEDQRLIRAGRIATTPEALREFAQQLGPADEVALESSWNTWAVVELLRQHAGRVVVSNPMQTRAIAQGRVKTDEVDAATLAQLLRADFLPEVWVPDEKTRELRRRVAERRALAVQQARLRNRIHAVLLRNLRPCPHQDLLGKAGRSWLARVELPAAEREQVERALRLLDAFAPELAAADRTIAALVVEDARVRRLLTIPGVGPAVAAGLVALIGDHHRFARPQKLVGYLGLDPRVRQSGERPARTGHISRAGQAHARWLLVEAAHAAVRVPGPLRAFFVRIARRRGPQIAVVATARKLAVLAWHLLHDGTEYRWAPARLVRQKRRALERTAGLAKTRTREALPDAALERRALLQAEEAYREFVRARTKRDAAAANGEATSRARKGQVRGGGLIPTSSALPTGSTASRKRIRRLPKEVGS